MEALEIVLSDYEIERGKPMPSKNHGRLQAKLIGLLYVSCGQTHTIYSELSLTLSPLFAKLVPDVALYQGVTAYSTSDEITMVEPPATAIEILSPSQSLTELSIKAEQYLQADVKSCWIVVPEFCIVVVSTKPGSYQTFERHETLTDPATGIELNLEQLFK